MKTHDPLEPLLKQIESNLRSMGLWDFQAPSEEALCSEAPFSHDTLEFYQWLQWIFLPRTRMLSRNHAPLPTQSDIHSMAELYFQTQSIGATDLLMTIKSIDSYFTSGQ